MPLTNGFFWSIVLVGFSGMFVCGRFELLYRDLGEVSDGLDLTNASWIFQPSSENTDTEFQFFLS